MALTTPALPTAIEGLQQDSTMASNQPAPNPCIAAGRALCFAGQGGNTSGTGTANQAVGVASIPGGTANGAGIVVPNTLVGAKTLVFLQLTGTGGTISEVTVNPAQHVPGTSFTITVAASGPTTGAVDCWYWLVN